MKEGLSSVTHSFCPEKCVFPEMTLQRSIILNKATALLDSDLNRAAINTLNGEILDIQTNPHVARYVWLQSHSFPRKGVGT